VAERSGAAASSAWRHSAAEVGTVPWLWMILTPRDAAGEVHLLPLRDLIAQLAGDPGVALAQIGGNLLVYRRVRGAGAATVPAADPPAGPHRPGCSRPAGGGDTAVALASGRVSSIDDMLLNAAGAG
jgi:hypothetical protein